MPYYDYECKKCGLEFEEFHKIDEREEPCKLVPHPKCDVYIAPHHGTAECEVKLKVCFPGLADPIRLGLRKPDDGFKDMMKRMKKNVPGAQDMPLRF